MMRSGSPLPRLQGRGEKAQQPCQSAREHLSCLDGDHASNRGGTMSIDKSLRRKDSLVRARNVLTRGERIKQMQNEERWPDDRSPFGLPKVKVIKIAKKVKKAKEEE